MEAAGRGVEGAVFLDVAKPPQHYLNMSIPNEALQKVRDNGA